MSEQPIQDTTTDFKPVEGPVRDSVPYLAPDLPLYFVPRAELETVKRLLLSRPAASLAPITLHGPAGSGKTSLAAALAHDADILERFRWRAVGLAAGRGHPRADAVGRALGDDLAGVPVTASRSATLRTLRDRRAARPRRRNEVEEIRAERRSSAPASSRPGRATRCCSPLRHAALRSASSARTGAQAPTAWAGCSQPLPTVRKSSSGSRARRWRWRSSARKRQGMNMRPPNCWRRSRGRWRRSTGTTRKLGRGRWGCSSTSCSRASAASSTARHPARGLRAGRGNRSPLRRRQPAGAALDEAEAL